MPKDLNVQLPSTTKSAREKILDLQTTFARAKYQEVTILLKPDVVTIKAKRHNGDNVFERIYGDEDFFQKETVRCVKLNPDQRRKHVKSLRRNGLTQAEIAGRVGVSQKTVSNDLVTLGIK